MGALMAVLAVAPAAGAATTQSASSGAVRATFAFTATKGTYATKTLTISRSGRVVYREPVSSTYCGPNAAAQKYCAPGAFGQGHKAVHVVDLEPGGEPDVVLDLYTGGAHCCTVEQVFSFDPATGSYVRSEHYFGNPGERIVDLGHDGRLEFLTADNAFAYAFTDFAASGLPIEILTFAHGSFVNVTHQYPKLIAKDAASFLKAFNRDHSDGDGLIAAWAADEDSLGHRALVANVLARELKAGDLHGLNYRSGEKFLAALGKFLRKYGYLH
ncbi:MAG TPA: hypothetical protein VG186_05750 [Solirubrobacteraceae bacterium]|nr:hypothetical protein [Solirubrobacteraceae bacterium]